MESPLQLTSWIMWYKITYTWDGGCRKNWVAGISGKGLMILPAFLWWGNVSRSDHVTGSFRLPPSFFYCCNGYVQRIVFHNIPSLIPSRIFFPLPALSCFSSLRGGYIYICLAILFRLRMGIRPPCPYSNCLFSAVWSIPSLQESLPTIKRKFLWLRPKIAMTYGYNLNVEKVVWQESIRLTTAVSFPLFHDLLYHKFLRYGTKCWFLPVKHLIVPITVFPLLS